MASCPACFPIFSFLVPILGLGALGTFEPILINYILPFMVLISLIGSSFDFNKNRNWFPFILAFISASVFFYSFYLNFSYRVLYSGIIGLFMASILNFLINKKSLSCKTINRIKTILESTITCPECGHQEKEKMPTNACVYFYFCKNCGVKLKAKGNDCCVFCSYGNVACPPIQLSGKCC